MNINKQPIKTTIRIKTTALVGFLLPLHATLHAGEATQAQPPPTAAHEVSLERMQKVYDEVKTPYKYGVVIRGEANQLVDSPSVFRKDNQWYMVYIASAGNVGYETCLARSADLLKWTKWTGPDLVKSSEPWDKTYAHKPYIVKHDGVVYHFYCAVGDQGRVIALATSKDLRNESSRGNKP